jgi:hypothetical protein
LESIKNFGAKARRKEPLKRAKCRWVDNIKKDLKKIAWSSMDSADLAEVGDQ